MLRSFSLPAIALASLLELGLVGSATAPSALAQAPVPRGSNPALPPPRPAPASSIPRVEVPAGVLLGIDVLEHSNFLLLRGKRIGLLTHPAGVDRRGISTVEVLHHAPGVRLVALFATEHGLWNNVAGGKHFTDAVDARTGLPVYSLYTGSPSVPTPSSSQLKGIDAMVIDLQDIGSRSYTFSGTMKTVMEACFRHKVEVIILDRPNPLGGLKVDGPMPDPAIVGASLVCEFPVPYVHGLTMGELARLAYGTPGVLQVKEAERLRGKLTIIPMVGWRRSMRWTETGLAWVPTSPYISDFAAVMGYPMTGLGCPDFDSFRNGIGSQYPFRGISNLLVKPDIVARELRALNLPGLNFRQVSVPNARTGKPGTGLYIEVVDWDELHPTDLNFYLMKLACKLEPRNPFAHLTKMQESKFLHEMGCTALYRDLAAHGARVDIDAYIRLWRAQDAQYQQRSRRFWLYP